MEYAVHFSKGTRGGPAACQLRGMFEGDGREDGGEGTAMPLGPGASRNRQDLGAEASRPAFGTTGGARRRSCCLCGDGGEHAGEPLFPSPCSCGDKFVHRSCMQNRLHLYHEQASCPTCKALYPVKRHTKPTWKWFWEEQSREQGLMFAATLVFTVGNVGVMAMAWMYLLFEYHPRSTVPAALIASALFVITIFWLAFSCFRIHTLYKPLARWKRANTTLEVILDEVRAEQV